MAKIFFGLSLAATLALAACAQSPTASAPSAAGPPPLGPQTLNVADAAIAGGNPDMALSVTQSVLASNPNDPDALIHEGDAYYALNRCPAAEAAYQLALEHAPNASPAETGLGRCLIKTDPAAAEQAFEKAVQDDPGNANALNDLGIARDLQGKFAGAVDPYRRALLADPSLTAAEVNLGLSLALSGNGPAALQYLGPLATSQQATPKIREDYAAALVATGRRDEAQQVLSVDLPPDQVVSAMNGFASVIAQSEAAQSAAPAAPLPQTVSQVVSSPPIAAQPLTPQPAAAGMPKPLAPVLASAASPPAVPSAAPAPVQDPDAAYTGPSPIPVTASSSTPGPATMPAMAKPVAPAPAPAPAPLPPASPATTAQVEKGHAVQLGALNSADAAERDWQAITAAAPALFNGKSPDIEPADVNGHAFYRLRVDGFASGAAASKFCAEVLAAGSPCTPANF